uniref:Ig-like domain-containing protein n=1 Tax=Anas platyrhynchos platyrhynchos TaxID=8840 RepID=A0A493TC34_ANAPP
AAGPPRSASVEEPQIQQSPAELWLPPGATAELNCSISGSTDRASWYREKPDGSLEWIYWSAAASKPNGKYSGMMRAWGIFSLSISDVQREDSGYYYCTSSVLYSQFGNGTRLLVTSECGSVWRCWGHPWGHPWGHWVFPLTFRCLRAQGLHPGARGHGGALRLCPPPVPTPQWLGHRPLAAWQGHPSDGHGRGRARGSRCLEPHLGLGRALGRGHELHGHGARHGQDHQRDHRHG